MDIELIQWPAQTELRNRLAERRQTRLLLVARKADPPVSDDILEDWVRLPVTDQDLRARIRDLLSRAAAHQRRTPTIDRHGVLHTARGSAALSPLHAALVRVLLDNLGKVVARSELEAAGWQQQVPERNRLDVHMTRIRRRIEETGLSIKTVRSRGYLLENPEPAV